MGPRINEHLLGDDEGVVRTARGYGTGDALSEAVVMRLGYSAVPIGLDVAYVTPGSWNTKSRNSGDCQLSLELRCYRPINNLFDQIAEVASSSLAILPAQNIRRCRLRLTILSRAPSNSHGDALDFSLRRSPM
jgi:hypothetical protein